METQQILILLGIGLAAGLTSGLLGIGGGIIIIPMLVGLLGFTQQGAQGTSLGLLLMPIGILGVMNYYKAGHVNIKAALFMATTFVIGSYLSSKVAVQLPEVIIKKIFGVFLFIYAIKLFLSK
ncbi:MAG: sulfite exporter TauE/SafE family protein [Ignavibacteriaceae bacterium]|nr:sulfite exporter TauE/SafE family protein [Ignavibacteriaceae bacterium]